MKRIAIALAAVLTIFATSAWAEWVLIGPSGSTNYYLDPATKRKTGSTARMWVLSDYATPKQDASNASYLSTVAYHEFQCEDGRGRLGNFVYYSGNKGTGNVVYQSNRQGDFEPVVPNTVGAKLLEVACSRESGTPPRAAARNSPADFDVVNRSSEAIFVVRVSPVSNDSWGEDRLGDEQTLAPGQRTRIRVPGAQCNYDVQVEYQSRQYEERRRQNLCATREMVFDGTTRRSPQEATTNRPPRPSAAAPASRGRSFGTGFFVSAQGHALTNNHVTASCRSMVAVIEGREFPAHLVRRDERNDLALIKVQTGAAVPFANFRASPAIKAGEGVVAAGFPLPGVLENGLNVTLGNVSALAGIGGNTALLQVTAPVQPGNSGGPLLDMSGNVVGVVVSKLDATQVAQATGDIPQNINFAVQGPVARLFLEAGGQAVAERPSVKDLPIGEVGDRARAYTFQIECR